MGNSSRQNPSIFISSWFVVQLAVTGTLFGMTLIIGYIFKNTAQVIVDSAITYENEFAHLFNVQSEERSTFGESVILTDEVTVVESGQKLVQLSNNVLGAFSGSSTEGFSTLSDLKMLLSATADVKVSRLLHEYFQQNQLQDTDYIIAFNEDGQAKLLGYSRNVVNILSKEKAFFMFGSGRDNAILRDAFTIKYNSWMNDIRLNASPDELLIGAITTCQLASLNALTINQGAGGFYNGAYVDRSSVIWSADTFNFMYSWLDFHRAPQFVVQKYNRGEATLVYSTLLQGSKVLMNAGGSLSPEAWVHQWREHLIAKALKVEVDYFVFVSYDRMIASIFHKSVFERAPMLFEIGHIPPDKNEFTFSEFMLKVLSGEIANCKIGPNTICVNFYSEGGI